MSKAACKAVICIKVIEGKNELIQLSINDDYVLIEDNQLSDKQYDILTQSAEETAELQNKILYLKAKAREEVIKLN